MKPNSPVRGEFPSKVVLVLERVVSLMLSLSLLAGPGTSPDVPASGAAPRSSEMEMTFRKTVQEVRVNFSVSLQNGRPAPKLEPSDFAVYQDNRPITGITGFFADQNLPLRLLLMIDASSSMTRRFVSEQNAAAAFLRRVVRPGVDQSALASFSTRLALDAGADASSPETLRRVISMLRSDGLTALYDSLYETASMFSTRNPDRTPTRRVIVLLSDGDDNYSLHSLQDAIAAAQKSDLVIYAIAAHNPNFIYPGDPVLEELTKETGGRLFIVKKYEQSEKVFAEIEQEIRSQFTVTFHPAGNTCGYHSLRVEPADRSLRARSRTGFYGDCS
jgi:Ca-activated chloride channel homolog